MLTSSYSQSLSFLRNSNPSYLRGSKSNSPNFRCSRYSKRSLGTIRTIQSLMIMMISYFPRSYLRSYRSLSFRWSLIGWISWILMSYLSSNLSWMRNCFPSWSCQSYQNLKRQMIPKSCWQNSQSWKSRWIHWNWTGYFRNLKRQNFRKSWIDCSPSWKIGYFRSWMNQTTDYSKNSNSQSWSCQNCPNSNLLTTESFAMSWIRYSLKNCSQRSYYRWIGWIQSWNLNYFPKSWKGCFRNYWIDCSQKSWNHWIQKSCLSWIRWNSIRSCYL
jgi:hypothetical protein